MYEVILETRENFRVKLVADEDALFPENAGATPVLQLDYMGYGSYRAEALNDQAAEFLDAFQRFCGEYSSVRKPLEVFERYLKIFYGTVKVQTWNIGITREFGYMAFDTAEWRETVGAPLESLKDEDYLTEVRAWADGDVWGYVVERQLNYTKTYAEDPDLTEEDSEWLEVAGGSCWGFYGREWAEESALQALTDCITLDCKP